MNLDDRTQLRRYNAARQPWSKRSERQRRPINWWGLVLPACLLVGALLTPAVLYILIASARTL
jgi:type IV secretory pathway TrbF-like protein